MTDTTWFTKVLTAAFCLAFFLPFSPIASANTGAANVKTVQMHSGHGHGLHHGAHASGSDGSKLLLSKIAVPGQDLVIQAGQVVTIDASVDIGVLTINGELRCPQSGSFQLGTAGIMVNGLFECGNARDRFEGQLNIVLKPGRDLHGMGERALVAHHGTVRLFGATRNAGWQRIRKTAEPGQKSLELESPVQWALGDEIVLAPTGFDPHEAERFKVAKVQGTTVYLDRPLHFRHWGKDQIVQSGGKRWIVSERAEVANLTRNIRIFPSGSEESHDLIGAHMMVMKGGTAYIDSVELIRMGQMGKLGRYPFHWHRTGNVNGQFIVNSSIHDTYQRCITVHGTQQALVKNNVCFNHFAHGFFLEDGDETENSIIGNLGILSKRVLKERILLLSDFGGGDLARFPSPSTFWISNPSNTVTDNVAAGSEGTGFWMSFADAIKCVDGANACTEVQDVKHATVRPLHANTIAFDSNTAHSALVGITWDGFEKGVHTDKRELVSAHYSPQSMPIFKDLFAYKNAYAGVYFRGRTVEFRDSVFADNGWSLFFAYNQRVRNTLVLARSENRTEADYDYFFKIGRGPDLSGIVVYDGPFDLSEIDFVGFSVKPEIYKNVEINHIPITAIGGANRFTNLIERIRFTPEPFKRFYFSENLNWVDSPYTMSIRDRDGTLSGVAGALLVPRHPFNNHPTCVERPLNNAYLCNYRAGLIIFLVTNTFPFNVTRSDGAMTWPSLEKAEQAVQDPVHPYHNKFNMILNSGFEYSVAFPKVFSPPPSIPFFFQTESVGETSPVVRLEKLGFCELRGAKNRRSLEELRRNDDQGYFKTNGDLYIKMRTERPSPDTTTTDDPNGTTGAQYIDCDVTKAEGLAPVFRLRKNSNYVHSTASSFAGYQLEGEAFKLQRAAGSGLTALLICAIRDVRDAHFLSADPSCEGHLKVAELGFMTSAPVGKARPLYRFYHPTVGRHLITTSKEEGESNGYQLEGTLGFVW